MVKRAVLAFLLAVVVGTRAEAFCFRRAGALYAINPRLLEAIARVESNMDPRAVNRNRNGSYDYGLMQINSRWQEQLGERWQYLLSDACYNVMVGAWVLRRCIERYGYTWDAVSCYHTGRPLGKLRGKRKARATRYIGKVKAALGGIP